MDDPEFNPEELTPQTASPPVPGEPEGNVPLEDVQADLDAVMESLDHELPQPDLESTHEDQPPSEQSFEEHRIPDIELDEDPLAEDPFGPPTDEVQDLAQHDQDLASELESLETTAPTQAAPQKAPDSQSQPRGFSFPGLPSSTGSGATAETLGEDGFFTQKMEQEGAGRDAQSFMFRAETRHHGLMNEAMIEYGRHLELLSDRYERDRL